MRGAGARPSEVDEWREAQQDIARLDPPVEGDPYDVSPSRFVIVVEDEPFYCGETGLQSVLLVYGCFRTDSGGSDGDGEGEGDGGTAIGAIRYFPRKTGALRHEARHAILFALGDSRWPDVGH
jgi:hypothetical protein